MVLSPELALLFGISSAITWMVFSTHLAARYAGTRLRGAALPRRWLPGKGSWLDVSVWVVAILALFVIWLAVALNDAQPVATRVVGALHTVVAIGWVAYLRLLIQRRPRSRLD